MPNKWKINFFLKFDNHSSGEKYTQTDNATFATNEYY